MTKFKQILNPQQFSFQRKGSKLFRKNSLSVFAKSFAKTILILLKTAHFLYWHAHLLCFSYSFAKTLDGGGPHPLYSCWWQKSSCLQGQVCVWPCRQHSRHVVVFLTIPPSRTYVFFAEGAVKISNSWTVSYNTLFFASVVQRCFPRIYIYMSVCLCSRLSSYSYFLLRLRR